MSGCTLTYKEGRSPALVDGSVLRPDVLCSLDESSLAATPLRIGRQTLTLSEVFDIGPASRDDTLIVRNAPPLDFLGANMTRGSLIIEGDAGDDLGASMSGGLIRVFGDAGHRVGGPHPTSRRGMTGGEILIDGNAGDFTGFLTRRGLIAIGGATGRSVGYRMIAGTIVLLRGPGEEPGLQMQRGTILCLGDAPCDAMGSQMIEGNVIGAGAMPALMLVLRRLRELSWPVREGEASPGNEPRTPVALSRLLPSGRWRIFSGDRFELNKGEVLQWES